jgi:hypothetical protein
MRSAKRSIFAAAAAFMIHGASAQEPVAATDREKLDQLFESWRGRPEQTLKEVWGRETSLTEGASTRTYMFERRKRGPNVGFGGITVLNSGNTVCTAYFQIGLEDIVTRTTWRGPDAGVCWDLFREYAPPAAE